MKSVFVEFKEIADDLCKLWAKYLPSDLKSVSKKIDRKLNEQRLSIQIYGNYNSGKSTLVNALLGTSRAKVGDVPVTDSIDSYDWNGYTLLDSPGVNAPIEHENIANDELQQRSLVLFVIRQDDQDAEDVYKRVFSQLEKGKQVFIVLNYQGLDKTGVGEGSVEKLVGQVFNILKKEEIKYNAAANSINKIRVLPVNLRSAMKGRIENKNLLIEKSGYDSFLSQFKDWVASHDSETHFVEDIRNYLINEIVQPLEEFLSKHADANKELTESRDRLNLIESQNNDMIIQSDATIRSKLSIVRNEIHQTIETSRSNGEVQNKVEEICSRIVKEMGDWLVSMDGKFTAKFSKASGVSTSSLSELQQPIVNMDNTQDVMASQVTGLLKDQGAVKSIVKTAEKAGILNGKIGASLSKNLSKAAPFINIAIGLIEMFIASNKQAKENTDRQNHALQVSRNVETIVSDLSQGLREDIRNTINDHYQDEIARCEKAVEDQTRELGDYNADLTLVNNLRQKINAVYVK